MKKPLLLIFGVILIALGIYFTLTKNVPGDTHELNVAAYPLYDGVTWGEGHADIQEGLTGFSITSLQSATTSDIAAITKPFEDYYQNKLTNDGWSVDTALAAGGAGSSLTAYHKGSVYLVIGYSTKFFGGGVNEPVQCPCRVTLGIFSGAVSK